MNEVASIILGGGEGTRLFPLTLTQCKPAIHFGGKYRLIDIPISQSIHANCHKIFVLTQFLSSSLHHHNIQTYMQRGSGTNRIEILAAEQKPNRKEWYQGTADAVRQNIDYLLESPVDYFLVLSGDQLYNIDFVDMFRFAKSVDADLVISSLLVNAQDASRMGVLKVNQKNFITNFHEKPQDPALLRKLRLPNNQFEQLGYSPKSQEKYLGSMGIYLFKRKSLVDLLIKDPRADFGKHLIATQLENGKAAAYLHKGYWEDVGTVGTFYQANMALTQPSPPFTLHHEIRPIFSYRNDLPPAKFSDTRMKDSLLCEGAIIEAKELTRSILGARTVIHKGAVIRDSYIMGNDYYTSAVRDFHRRPLHPHIGENSFISRTIVEKNVSIGQGVQLINKQKLTHYDGDNIFIRDGIIIVPQGAVIPDGFIL